MVDYSIYYREELPLTATWPAQGAWDLFLSAYNESERVRVAFTKAVARRKQWILCPEYKFSLPEYPSGGDVFASAAGSEDEFLGEYFRGARIDWAQANVAVDITGFTRPYLLLLVKMLRDLGVKRFDAIYSEPERYQDKEKTAFSDGPVIAVRQVAGFAGSHDPDNSNDLLIVGVGYDHELISHVANDKEGAQVIGLYGLPSLRADMYQESLLRASQAEEALADNEQGLGRYFAPANDPFITAGVLREIVDKASAQSPITNLYLSPLSTKPVTLGFALYYLCELESAAASIIFPYSEQYKRETSTGIARAWKYVVEF